MRGIHHNNIHASRHQQFRAMQAVITNACRCCGTQPSHAIFRRIGIGLRLIHILHGHQAHATLRFIHYQQLFDAMLMQKRTRLIRRHIGGCGDKPLTRHQLIDP